MIKNIPFTVLSVCLLVSFSGCKYLERFRQGEPEQSIPGITGTWELVYYKGEDRQGRYHYPFDREVVGQAVFDTTGSFGIQIYDAEREVFPGADPFFNSNAEIRLAFLTARASFGYYEITEGRLNLTHTAATLPNLSGTMQVNDFIIQGDSLLIVSPEVILNGIALKEHTLWVRQ